MIRASSMPLAIKCPASQILSDAPRLIADPDITALGSASHKAQEFRHQGKPVPFDDLATAYGVDVGELKALYWAVARLWDCYFATIDMGGARYTEIELNHLDLTGHVDLLAVSGDGKTAYLFDYKFGWRDSDHTQQLLTYAYLACKNFPQVERVYAAIIWARHGEVEGHWYTPEALELWHEQTHKRLAESGYNPGRHCGDCPRFLECPAAREQLALAGDVLIDASQRNDLSEPDKFFSLHDACKILGKLLEETQNALRSQLAALGGRIENGEREIIFSEQNRREINPRIALPILRDRYGDEADGCCKLHLTGVRELVMSKAEHGTKGKAVDAMLAELENAGAVTTYTTKRMIEKRKVAEPLALKGE